MQGEKLENRYFLRLSWRPGDPTSSILARQVVTIAVYLITGTKVTVESFTRWKEQFDAELAALNLRDDLTKGRLTGKQMFLRDKALAESDLKFEGFGEDVDVDESLFQEDELADLDA